MQPQRYADNQLIDRFLAKGASRLRDRTGADLTLAGWVHPRTGLLSIRYTNGARTDACLGITAAPGKGIGGRAVKLGQHVLTDYRDRSAGNGPGEPGRVDCGEHVSSVLAIPLRLGGRALCVFYLAERSKKSISAATTKFALTFVRQFEIAVAQVTKTYETDAPRRWNVDERVLRQVDDELVALSLDVAATPALVRIATIRNLLEDSVLKSLSAVDSVNSLTRRELDVLELVAEGLSNTEAAERLVISPETVKSYLRTIRSKLGVHNRTAAVDLARRSGLLR